jgi:thioredoxin reductase
LIEPESYTFEADTVVNAMGYVPERNSRKTLKSQVPELYLIGDCVKPRNILHAVHEAAYVARQIWRSLERFKDEI